MSTRHGPFSGWHARAWLVLLFLLPISGCGGGRPSGTVSGTVTYKGAALTSGRVTFYGPNNQVASAPINEEGRYEATNVPLGLVKVAVDTPPPPPPEDYEPGQPGGRTAAGLYGMVRELGRKAGLKVWPHGLRHASITEALDATGGNIRAVQRFSRHKDVRVSPGKPRRSDQAGNPLAPHPG